MRIGLIPKMATSINSTSENGETSLPRSNRVAITTAMRPTNVVIAGMTTLGSPMDITRSTDDGHEPVALTHEGLASGFDLR
jgi:hypothetical protein